MSIKTSYNEGIEPVEGGRYFNSKVILGSTYIQNNGNIYGIEIAPKATTVWSCTYVSIDLWTP